MRREWVSPLSEVGIKNGKKTFFTGSLHPIGPIGCNKKTSVSVFFSIFSQRRTPALPLSSLSSPMLHLALPRTTAPSPMFIVYLDEHAPGCQPMARSPLPGQAVVTVNWSMLSPESILSPARRSLSIRFMKGDVMVSVICTPFLGTGRADHYASGLLPRVGPTSREEMALAETRGIAATFFDMPATIPQDTEAPYVALIAEAKQWIAWQLASVPGMDCLVVEAHDRVDIFSSKSLLAAPWCERLWFGQARECGGGHIVSYLLLPRGRAQVFTTLGELMPRPAQYVPSAYRRMAGLEEIRGNGAAAQAALRPSTLWSAGCSPLHGLVKLHLPNVLRAVEDVVAALALGKDTEKTVSLPTLFGVAIRGTSHGGVTMSMMDADVARIYRIRSSESSREVYVYDPIVLFHMCQLFYLLWTSAVHQLLLTMHSNALQGDLEIRILCHPEGETLQRLVTSSSGTYKDIALLAETMTETNGNIFEHLKAAPVFDPLLPLDLCTTVASRDTIVGKLVRRGYPTGASDTMELAD